jgi:hypothetical protein
MRAVALVAALTLLGCNLVADLTGYEVVSTGGAGGTGMGGDPTGGAGGMNVGGEGLPPCGGACEGTFQWSVEIGGVNRQTLKAVTTDPEDAIYVGVDFLNEAVIDGTTFVANDIAETDILVAKLAPSGAVEWTFATQDFRNELIGGLAVDADGGLVVVGSFEEDLTIGATTLNAGPVADLLVFKLDDAGMPTWAIQAGASSTTRGNGVIAHPMGGVIVVGEFLGPLDITGALTTFGNFDGFIAYIGADGVPVWSQSVGGTGPDGVTHVAAAPDGGFVVVGRMGSTVNVGGRPLTYNDGSDFYVAKYDMAGVHDWSRSFGGAENDIVESLVVDADGRVLLAGTFRDSVDFGGPSMTTSAGEEDAFVLALAADGSFSSVERWGDEAEQAALAITDDTFGNVLLGGGFWGALNFGGEELVASASGDEDLFFAKFDLAGTHHYSRRLGNPTQDQRVTNLHRDQNDNGIVGGEFEGQVNFGGGPLNANGQDVFLVKLTP